MLSSDTIRTIAGHVLECGAKYSKSAGRADSLAFKAAMDAAAAQSPPFASSGEPHGDFQIDGLRERLLAGYERYAKLSKQVEVEGDSITGGARRSLLVDLEADIDRVEAVMRRVIAEEDM